MMFALVARAAAICQARGRKVATIAEAREMLLTPSRAAQKL